MAPPTSSADADDPEEDGHRVGHRGALILRRLRDDGPDATVQLDPPTDDKTSAKREAQTIRRLADDGYIEPTEPGSRDYRITGAGIAALEAFEAEWRDIVKRIGMQTGLADTSGLKRIVDGMFPSLSVTQSFLASVDSSIARQLQTATKSLLPTARATDQWATRVLEASGIGESLRRFSESVARSTPRINLDLSSVHFGWDCLFLDPDEFDVPEFLAATGIPLAGSTPPHVAQVLMGADAEYREATLLAHRADIYAQCRYVLEQDHADRAASATLTLDALDLLEAGHFAGAQALASCALDPVSTLALARGVELGMIPRPDGLNDAQYRLYRIAAPDVPPARDAEGAESPPGSDPIRHRALPAHVTGLPVDDHPSCAAEFPGPYMGRST